MKKVTFGGKPTSRKANMSSDQWVTDRGGVTEATKRLTIDVPLSLHQRVKSQCALKGEKMADVVRNLLEERFGEEYPDRGGGEANA